MEVLMAQAQSGEVMNFPPVHHAPRPLFFFLRLHKFLNNYKMI
jgi:hypothetical protein